MNFFFFNWRNILSNDYIVAKKCNLKKIRQDILRSLLSLLCLYLSAHLLFLYLCMCLFMYVLVYMCLFMWLCILHSCIVHVWMCMWIMNTYLLLCLCVCAYEYERHISDPASIRPRRHQRVHWKIRFAGKKYISARNCHWVHRKESHSCRNRHRVYRKESRFSRSHNRVWLEFTKF